MAAELGAARGEATFFSAMAEAERYKRWQLGLFRGHVGGSVLEVGVGDGGFRPLLPPASRYVGLDLDRPALHLRRYTIAGVRRLVPGDCRLLRLGYVNPMGAGGWWANRFRRHRSLEDRSVRWQVIRFDRVALPPSRLLPPLTRRLFGQSVAAVVAKS